VVERNVAKAAAVGKIRPGLLSFYKYKKAIGIWEARGLANRLLDVRILLAALARSGEFKKKGIPLSLYFRTT
jgi:hypothetical protein